MAKRSPSPMEMAGSDSESESDRSRSPSPELTYEDYQRVVKEKEALQRQVEELTQQVKDLTERLQQQEEQAKIRHEELLKRLPIIEAPTPKNPPQTKGKRKKNTALGESGSDEEPAKLPRTKEPQEDEQSSLEGPSTAPQTEPKTPDANDKTPRIPPVILRKKEKWTSISALLKLEKINFTRAKLTGEGIAITPASAQDHRRLTATLNRTKEEYHTYSLQEEKMLRVVIRGIPSGVPLEEIAEDLKGQGFDPKTIHRMTSRRTKQEMPLVLVKAPQEQTSLLEVRRCCSLVVKVEPQKTNQEATQCHRCQRFGHGQSRCTAQTRCVKCGENHHSAECKKTRDAPAKCANCGGPHPASYRGCPKYPKKTANKKTTETRQQESQEQHKKAKSQQTPKVAATRSFADAARQKQAPAAAPEGARKSARSTDPADVASMLAQMREWYSAMSAFFNKMPSLLQE